MSLWGKQCSVTPTGGQTHILHRVPISATDDCQCTSAGRYCAPARDQDPCFRPTEELDFGGAAHARDSKLVLASRQRRQTPAGLRGRVNLPGKNGPFIALASPAQTKAPALIPLRRSLADSLIGNETTILSLCKWLKRWCRGTETNRFAASNPLQSCTLQCGGMMPDAAGPK